MISILPKNENHADFTVAPLLYTFLFGQYTTVGSASNLGGGCYQIAPNAPAQAGAVWSNTPINFNFDFCITENLYFGNNDGGADGIAMIFQTAEPGFLGATGGCLGHCGLAPAVAIEFDTWDNGAGIYGDMIWQDHTAINLIGNLGAPVAGPVQASSVSVNIEDGVNHTLQVCWNATTKTITVSFDGVNRLSYVNDVVANVFGGNPSVTWGFVATTGGATNQQNVCITSVLNSSGIELDAITETERIALSWTSSECVGEGDFILEKYHSSYAGWAELHRPPVEPGCLSGTQYQYADHEPTIGINLYRVKYVSASDETTYSETAHAIFIPDNQGIVELVSNPAPTGTNVKLILHLKGSPETEIQISDPTRKKLLSMTKTMVGSIETLSVPCETWPCGIYFVEVRNYLHSEVVKLVLQ